MTFKALIYVFLGGGTGAVFRFLLANWIVRVSSPFFPYGTAVVNIIGSLLIGIIMTALVNRGMEQSYWRLLLVVGLLGGFTTFSSFSWETIALFRSGAALQGLANILLNVLVCLMAATAGSAIGKAL